MIPRQRPIPRNEEEVDFGAVLLPSLHSGFLDRKEPEILGKPTEEIASCIKAPDGFSPAQTAA